jgi:hypothetical protein
MPTARKLLAGLVLALTAVSCSEDKSPTAPATTDNLTPPTTAVAGRAALLTNVHVTGLSKKDPAALTDVLTDPFEGSLTVTSMRLDPTTHKLLVSGTITTADGTGTFTDAPATLTKEGAPTQPTCQILILDLGPLHLDLLGLVVDLAPVHLDVHAESGPGNLLGNLLCAVANLLNGPNLNALVGAITNLLNQITAILQGA